MSSFKITVDNGSNILKFQQLVESIIHSISRNELKPGDMLPSVNQLMSECQLSRDTVFKAYAELKKRGVVESVPNRGYFVTQKITRVLLFLDTFKAYKEVLYGSFLKHLPKNVMVDLHFHHYNIDVFEKIISESLGKYSKYVVMNFDDARVPEIIGKISPEKLLVIDWKIHSSEIHSVVYQDFGESVFDCLSENALLVKKYKEFILYYPPFTYHPIEIADYFNKFCQRFKVKHSVVFNEDEFKVKKGALYLLVSDRTLATFLDQCFENGWEPGVDAGVISYNETPMKKYVKNGITVISTDFEMMGHAAADFVAGDQPVQIKIPTTIKLRSSL